MAETNAQTYKTGNEVRPRAQAQEVESAAEGVGREIDREVTRLQKNRVRTIQAQKRKQVKRVEEEENRGVKLSGFGFTMILGVALLKDTVDVLGAITNLIIFSFGSSALAGVASYAVFDSVFAGFLGAIIPNFIKLTGIGTGAIGAINLGLSVTFSLVVLFVSLFLFFVILMYLGFQQISITARKLATIAGSFIIGILPLLNWLPETFFMLLILKHYENKKQKPAKGAREIKGVEPLPA